MNKSFLPYAFGKKKWKPVGIASIPCIDEFYNTFPQLHLVGTMKALHSLMASVSFHLFVVVADTSSK